MSMISAFRLFRLISGRTQIQVANATRMTTSRISLIENNLVSPRDDEKARLAAALGIKPEEIWSGNERQGQQE